LVLMANNDGGGPRGWLTDRDLAAQVRNEMRSSDDVALVGRVARDFVGDATTKAVEGAPVDFAALKAVAAELVEHAQTLEPQNRDWADLMEGVKGLPSTQMQPPAAPQFLRIGGGVAAHMLLKSSPPLYPPLARMARIQGVVKLQVRIGADGHVTETTLLSGHPLLVPAAMDAVKRYVYKPFTMEGKTVEALTSVDVTFTLGVE
jgi:TonB family protein